MTDLHDLVGIGIGPFNLSLAALADRLDDVTAVFFDTRPEFSWHPGMLIEGTTLQVPFLADLVTLVDPTSPWSFLAYLREHDRLFPFYFAERFHVSRREYDDYCRWVSRSLDSCRFGATVRSVTPSDDDTWEVHVEGPAGTRRVRGRNVVLGIGTAPVVPAPMRALLGNRVFHSADYLYRADEIGAEDSVTVIGSGQSGAEVFLDLLRRGYRNLHWLTRSPAFAPMEYSKLGLEHFTPDYTGYFQGLPRTVRADLVPAQWQLYKAISAETIAEIHDLLYERLTHGAPTPLLTPNVEATAARLHEHRIEISCRQRQQGREFTVDTDAVVLATGYAERPPECLDPVVRLVNRDAEGRLQIGPDFRLDLSEPRAGGIFVQNAETHSHGVGTPDLGLGAHRAATILNSLTGRVAYRLPTRTAFTTFGAP